MKKLIGTLLLALTADAHATAFFNQPTFAFIDLLEWQVQESGADNWAQLITPAGRHRTIKVKAVPFDWNTGIRVGVGQTLFQDCFDWTIFYTHYNTTALKQASGPLFSSFVANYFANNTNGANFGPNYRNGSIRWQVFYNTVDFELGRKFRIDSVLQLHPYIGLKAASINQNIYTNWHHPLTATNFTAASENLKNDFWGIGPTIGADSTWPIYRDACQSFSLIGNVGFGLLWGHWHFNDVYTNNAPTKITVNVKSVNGAAPVANGLLGMQWERRFAQSDISVHLGYETQIWFNQMQFYSLNIGRLNRPVSIQGGNLGIRFNF